MIGASSMDLVLGSRPPGDKTDLIKYVRELARIGMHVVLVEPMGKNPLDMRSRQQRTAEDNDAQLAAQQAGNPRWAAVKAPAGVHLATDDEKLLNRYMAAAAKRYGPDQVNLGIEVGRSRILMVDADTPEAVAAWQQASGVGGPTVSTPGKFDAKTNTWVHSQGGHWYFTVPEGIELPTGGTGAYTPAQNSWVAYWGNRQLLIPPSVRAEGAYRWNGGVQPLPQWLFDVIMDQTAQRKAKAAARIERIGDSPIDAWAAQVSWTDLLEPRGWVDTGRVSNCGCSEWTAPGPHDNPKSATAHDLGCSHEAYDGYAGHCPLHLWTDNPPAELGAYVAASGSRTMSKMQFVAWTDHRGDIEAACGDVGIPRTVGEPDPWLPARALFSPADFAERDRIIAQREQQVDQERFDHSPPFADAGDDDEADTRTEIQKWFDTHAGPWSKFRHLPAVEYLVDGFLDTNSLSNLIGARGVGKSFLGLDLAACIATGRPWQGRTVKQGRVAYMVGEGLHGFGERIRAWEKLHQTDLSEALLLIDEPVQVTNTELWNGLAWWCLHNDVTTLFLDTLGRISVGVEENSAKDMGRVVEALRQVQQFAGCHVSVVHHTTRGTDHGRGSTALEGAADTVLLVDRIEGSGTQFAVTCTKQKNHPEPEPMEFSLVPEVGGPSACVAGIDGVVRTSTDPFAVSPVAEPGIDERVAAVVATLRRVSPETGLTRALIVKHTPAGEITRRQTSRTAYEALVLAAIDAGVLEGKIEGAPTANGGQSTSRFIHAG